jgi:hypothetical protein
LAAHHALLVEILERQHMSAAVRLGEGVAREAAIEEEEEPVRVAREQRLPRVA